ncbi:hypothetical protein BG000_006611, partial [Podila horticola]
INKALDMQLSETTLPNNLLQQLLSLRGLIDEPDQPALCPISPVSHGFIQITELVLMQTIYRECMQEVKQALGITFK